MSTKRKRASIKSPCVADRYAGQNERIAEFTFPNGKGGLISLSHAVDGDRVFVHLYRLDAGISVSVEHGYNAREIARWCMGRTEDEVTAYLEACLKCLPST